MSKIVKTILIPLGASALILLSLFFIPPKLVAQTEPNSLTGYAWSENIGWIDFSKTLNNPGGVSVDGDNNLSGYAWSENIGWIKFGGLSGFPTGAGTYSQNAQIVSNKLIGWARACAGSTDGQCGTTSRLDGWDGWISLGGTNHDISLIGQTFSGFAWGSEVVGWIDFSRVALSSALIPPPDLSLSVIVPEIKWDSINADTCTLRKAGIEIDINNATSGIIIDYTLETGITFRLDCTGPGGSGFRVATSEVPASPSTCTATQPSNPPEETDFYVNRNTIWTISNSEGTPGTTKWSGTDIGTQIITSGGQLNKIYTTVGIKTINAATTINKTGGGTFSSYCSTTTLMKLDPGSSGEI